MEPLYSVQCVQPREVVETTEDGPCSGLVTVNIANIVSRGGAVAVCTSAGTNVNSSNNNVKSSVNNIKDLRRDRDVNTILGLFLLFQASCNSIGSSNTNG